MRLFLLRRITHEHSSCLCSGLGIPVWGVIRLYSITYKRQMSGMGMSRGGRKKQESFSNVANGVTD